MDRSATKVLTMKKLDLLAIAAHPDDVEISAGGTMAKLIAAGKECGIADLTRGELGTRGTAETRAKEAARASEVLRLSVRENLGLEDGFFRNDSETMKAVIRCIRRWQPDIILTNAPSDRHPDHGRASRLVAEAAFYSGLSKIETNDGESLQSAWRPRNVFFFVQDYLLKPDFVVDVTDFWEKKMEALSAYESQFYDPRSTEPSTPISGREFFDFLKARCTDFGRPAGYALAEGFIHSRISGVNDVFAFD
jgi:N-acetylglucosamine malate deacetylase 1